MNPTTEQLLTFEEQGFLHLPGALNPARVAQMRTAFEEMVDRLAADADTDQSNYRRVISQWTSIWEHTPLFKEQMFDANLGEFAAGLLRASSVQLFHDQVISKVPEHSGEVPWHQDLGYWPVDGARGVSCWIAMDDAEARSGAMQYMPGSHLRPVEPAIDFLQARKTWGPDQADPVAPSVRAGDAIFHDYRTWHMTAPNRTQNMRRAYIVIYLGNGVRYAPHKAKWAPINQRVTVAQGEPLNQDRFPILWRAK